MWKIGKEMQDFSKFCTMWNGRLQVQHLSRKGDQAPAIWTEANLHSLLKLHKLRTSYDRDSRQTALSLPIVFTQVLYILTLKVTYSNWKSVFTSPWTHIRPVSVWNSTGLRPITPSSLAYYTDIITPRLASVLIGDVLIPLWWITRLPLSIIWRECRISLSTWMNRLAM